MELSARLEGLSGRVMQKIGEAAERHDVPRIGVLSALADRIEEDRRLLEALRERADRYENDLSSTPTPATLAPSRASAADNSSRPRARDSKRGEGKDARARFVDSLRRSGIRLAPLAGKVYRTEGGKKLGIPFANELEGKPDRWFLGLKDGNYDVVAFLCNRRDGDTLEFVLPDELLRPIWSSLSRHAGEVKFNVVRDGNNYYLLVPPQRRESMTQFLRNYAALK